MEHTLDAALAQVGDQSLAKVERRHEHVEHVVSLFAVFRHVRKLHFVSHRPIFEVFIVEAPNPLAMGLDLFSVFQLGIQKRGQDIRRQVGGANVYPGVLVHLAAEEAAAIGAFLADDLGALDERRIVDQQCPSLAAREVLGFVEGLRRQRSKRSQVFALVFAK